MASPAVQKINEAQKVVWPAVSAATEVTMRSMRELAQISDAVLPRVEEYFSRGNGGPIRRRKVCEETIWALAQLGWLRTGPERDVIQAAKVYADVARDPDASDDEYEQVADELVAVIHGMPDYLNH